MIVQLIHNPASGSYSQVRHDLLHKAFEACGAKVHLAQTEIDGSLQIDAQADLICVSGGDGALRLVIQTLCRHDKQIPLCVFPAGTVNLVARELGYSSDPERFAGEVMGGYLAGENARLHAPVMAADGNPVAACLSAGPDGVAVANHNPRIKERLGRVAYGLSLVKLLARWPREKTLLHVKLTDGSEREISCAAFYVIKGRYFAGPWSIVPQAHLATVDFSLVALDKANRRSFVRFVLRIALGGDPENLKFVDVVQCQSLSIEKSGVPGDHRAFQMDGDPMSHRPEKIEMTDKVIKYCLPKGI